MSKIVNPDLYDFLKDNKTGLYKNNSKELTAYLHIPFCALEDFVKAVGDCYFDESIDIKMMANTIYIELNDIFDFFGHDLKDYKNCFNKADWKDYEEYIVLK